MAAEEFILLAPDAEPESSRALGERGRQAIWDQDIPYHDSRTTPRVTVSAASSSGPALEKIIKDADPAQYSAKASSRNRVVTAMSCPSPMAGVWGNSSLRRNADWSRGGLAPSRKLRGLVATFSASHADVFGWRCHSQNLMCSVHPTRPVTTPYPHPIDAV